MSEFKYDREKYKNYARRMAKQYNLPEHLFLGQLEQESNWNPKAKSHAGAVGIGQFMPNIHKVGSWKFKSKEDYFDPYKSIESAAMFMSNLKNKYNGNYMAALAHYNGGGRQGQLVMQGKQPNYSETAKYIQIIPQKAEKFVTPEQQQQTASVQPNPITQPVPVTPKEVIQQSQVRPPAPQPKTPVEPPQQQPAPVNPGNRNIMMERIKEYLNQQPVQQPKTPARPIPQIPPMDIPRMQPPVIPPVPQQPPQELPNRGQLLRDLGQGMQQFKLPTSQYQNVPNIQYRPSQSTMPQAQNAPISRAWQQRRGL